MKKKTLKNNNGITICDSIVMSVRRKRANLRRAEAVAIAVIGYISAIMSFVTMFDFRFNHKAVIFSAVIFSAIYILLSLFGKKAVWLIIATTAIGAVVSYKLIDTIILGCKYTYNVIYRTSTFKDIDYYKFLKPELEESSVTVLFIAGTWLLALVIYVFTIYHPNSLPPLLVTFPLIEIGLYNGIEISVFWGMLTVSYWLAVFAMTATDIGEYSGGNGGFVRKENLFFPKRQMKLKVTEKCGIYLIMTVIAITGISSAVLNIIDYKRSDELNKKRIEIRDAVNSFSAEDLAGSISELTSAFGFNFKVQSHKLGNVDRLRYKETTDLIVTLDDIYNGAVYLKEYTGSVYGNNEWTQLPGSAYNADIFSDFSDYSTYPQDFPYRFSRRINMYESDKTDYTIWINSRLRKNRSFAPYGTDNIGIREYDLDTSVTSKSGNEYSYRFTKVEAEDIAGKLNAFDTTVYSYNISDMTDSEWNNLLESYCNEKNLGNPFTIESSLIPTDNSGLVLSELIEKDYRDFVYENYLQLPDTDDINEIRSEFADILDSAQTYNAQDRIQTLTAIRSRVSSMVEYSLNPGRTPSTRDFVNYFLLENRKGYCTHYATAGVLLARMAGIPARYATGYVLVGDDFSESARNDDGSYTIELKDNRSHAWVEVYIDGYGWIPFEFTAGYSEQTIDTTPATTTTETTTAESTETTTVESSSEEDSTTTRNNQQTTTPRTVTDNNTTTVAVQETVVTTYVIGITDEPGTALPDSVKHTAYALTAVISAVLLVFLRRKIILYIRTRHFTDGSRRAHMGYIYGYAEKLL
ncbi:MAG: transglutaminase-like domain-containing protein, partial [Ruminococcus flavefaciens]|nr:transglutaminase-like domain-containing protein [Ruminococcus flavefaciens]